ncbi:hypothetical protein [Mesorhizobium sp.]|nr:hypothetical protein [Mesorhizobium sp.]
MGGATGDAAPQLGMAALDLARGAPENPLKANLLKAAGKSKK